MERRLAAILAADMVGYSRLMAADETGTLARQKTHRTELIDPKVAEYGGRVVKTTGDGLLVEFPSVVDALRCAVTIQLAMQDREAKVPQESRIAYRLGINLGDIVVEDDDIYGDGVNVAARLEALAEPGGICVSRTVVDHVKGKVSSDFDDLGEQSVKNIPEPIHVFSVRMAPEEAGATDIGAKGAKRRLFRAGAIAAAGVLLASLAAGLMVWQPWAPDFEPASVERMAFPLPDRPSIAVLPFANLSRGAEQDYIADGITEDIITAISQFRELFVIARNSSFTYKGKPVVVQQVAEDLGVRYVLEGSYRRTNNGLRITAQLIDALSGNHVWAETYDRDVSATLMVQDEIVEAIVTALAIKVEEAERQRAAGAANTSLKAYDLFLRARDLQLRKGFWNREVNLEVRRLQEKATALDPRFSRAYAELAWTHLYDFIFKWTEAVDRSRARAFELARKAVSLDHSNARAHYALGYVHLYANAHELAAAEVNKAIALNPNDARFHAGLAGLYIYGGDPQKAIRQMKEAMRLNPYHEDWYWNFLGWANFHAGNYDKALEALQRIVNPSAGAHRMLAATYARLDRLDEAAQQARESLKQEPDFSVSHFRKNMPYKNKSDGEAYYEALRLAGLPENPSLQLPDKPSIAVLPFVNMSGDTEQEYFVDGMTEDLITDLSRVSGLFVIDRSSVFTYKGKSVKVRDVSRELGVRYVLEGSVRKSGDRLRINTQLIDATTGGHVWAERYDRQLEEVFALQDQVVSRIVSTLHIRLAASEKLGLKHKHSNSVKAYDVYLRGRNEFVSRSIQGNRNAHALFEEAIELDPGFARGYAYLAWAHQRDYTRGWTTSPDRSLKLARTMIRRAIALDESSPLVQFVTSVIELSAKEHEKSIVAIEKALALDPNYSDAYVQLTQALSYAGRPEAGLEPMKKAMRLSPNPPLSYLGVLAQVYFSLGRYEEAAGLLEKGLNRNPTAQSFRMRLAATYARLDRIEEAEWESQEILAADPGFSLKWISQVEPYKDPAQLEALLGGLRKAGLPD